MLGLTAVVICTTGKLRMLLLGLDVVFAAAVGVFAYHTIEHPAHDATIAPDESAGAEGPEEGAERK